MPLCMDLALRSLLQGSEVAGMSKRDNYSSEELEHLRKAARLLEDARKADKRGSRSEAETLREKARTFLLRVEQGARE
jgi:hypothetical protein